MAHYHGRTRHRLVKRQTATCDPAAPFRHADGQCNNLDNQFWGSTSSLLDRIITNAYGDSKDSPRTLAVSHNSLPSAREVSLRVHPSSELTAEATLMLMQWGQFVDHDTTLTPHANTASPCTCTDDGEDCFPIPTPNDEYFTTRQCLEFTRSAHVVAADSLHAAPIRQQSNAITAFIDASMIYGSSDEEMDAVRGRHGTLKDTTVGRQDFLPAGDNSSCRATADVEFCFLAGDERVNEQPGLAAMHTIFMREHNRIARFFRSRTSWSGETIFQQTRKIVGAILQRITYNEYLPIVLGPKVMKDYNLNLDSYVYDPLRKPDILNAFATAAYRFGHSMIPDAIGLNSSSVLEFKNSFFSPAHVLKSFKSLASAISRQKAMGVDRQFSHSVTRHLFQTEEQSGFDLVALNIQRGRDHGLPSYTKYRDLCNSTQTNLIDLIPQGSDGSSVYESIDDIDLFTGGMAEKPVEGGLVGSTFACIIATQFQRLKFGDRFFYLTTEPTVGFTPSQRREINRVTLGKVVCENTSNKSLQMNIFLPANHKNNPLARCTSLSEMDLNAWLDAGDRIGDNGTGNSENKGHRDSTGNGDNIGNGDRGGSRRG